MKDEEARTHSDAMEMAVCPKCSSNPVKVFDDATWTSDGEEVKHYNICCQGTESSPCSQCSEDSQMKNPPHKNVKPTDELVQVKLSQHVVKRGGRRLQFLDPHWGGSTSSDVNRYKNVNYEVIQLLPKEHKTINNKDGILDQVSTLCRLCAKLT